MIKAGIIGATGYAGAELVRLLLGHGDVQIVWYGSRSYVDEKYADIYRNFFEIVPDKCLDDNIDELAEKVEELPTLYSVDLLNADTCRNELFLEDIRQYGREI